MTLWTDIKTASEAVKNDRTPFDICMYAMTELGELAEEIIIAEGRSYKEPGKDGVIGEAIDVALCLADLLMIQNPDLREIDCIRLVSCGNPAGQGLMEYFFQEGRTDRDLRQIYKSLSSKVVYTLEGAHPESFWQNSNQLVALNALALTMRTIRTYDPDVTFDKIHQIAAMKLDKWQEKAAQIAADPALAT